MSARLGRWQTKAGGAREMNVRSTRKSASKTRALTCPRKWRHRKPTCVDDIPTGHDVTAVSVQAKARNCGVALCDRDKNKGDTEREGKRERAREGERARERQSEREIERATSWSTKRTTYSSTYLVMTLVALKLARTCRGSALHSADGTRTSAAEAIVCWLFFCANSLACLSTVDISLRILCAVRDKVPSARRLPPRSPSGSIRSPIPSVGPARLPHERHARLSHHSLCHAT